MFPSTNPEASTRNFFVLFITAARRFRKYGLGAKGGRSYGGEVWMCVSSMWDLEVRKEK